MKPEVAAYEKPDVAVASRSKLNDLFILAKVRVNVLVVATTAGGYYMAGPAEIDPARLAITCLGTALVASGAAAINQVYERHTDRLMERTRLRPIAEGRMSPLEGTAIAAALSLAGLVTLALGSNMAAMWVALATLISYAAVYTPLKRRTSLATIVGAVPGALPPLIGWAAERGDVWGAAPWTLFVISFIWQLPHFLAIAWICRDDYGRAGLPMLSVVDPHGGAVGRQTVLWSAALIPCSLLPFLFGLAGPAYAIGSLVLGIAQFVMATRFAQHRSLANARALFYASIIYLPLLWALMVIGRAPFVTRLG